MFQTEKQIKEFGEKLDDNDKSSLEEIIKELKEVCEAEDMDKVNTLMETLNSTWQEISTKLYQQTEPEQPEPDNPSDEVTDVEYEEVKE